MSPKQNSLSGFYNYPPSRQELHIPPEHRFLKIVSKLVSIYLPQNKTMKKNTYMFHLIQNMLKIY